MAALQSHFRYARRVPQSRLVRALAGVPNVRAAASRQSATEVGVEGLAAVATSTTAATTLARLSINRLDSIAPTGRGLLLVAQEVFAFVVDTTQAKEFALAHWLVNGADGGRLFVRRFGGDGTVRENAAGTCWPRSPPWSGTRVRSRGPAARPWPMPR